MLEQRYVRYVLPALTIAGVLVCLGQQLSSAQVQTKVSPVSQPAAAPVSVTITEAGAVGDNLPTHLAGKAYVQNYVMQNLTSANVLAVTTRWTSKDAEGKPLPGRGCASQSAVTNDLPVLKAGESKTFQKTLAQGAPSAEAEIDLVLLDDGTAFGSNRCHDLGRIQAQLLCIKMTYLGMLRVLETGGPQALEALVRARAEEYQQAGHNDAFMKPKFIGR